MDGRAGYPAAAGNYAYPAQPQPGYGYPPAYGAPPPAYPAAYPGYPPSVGNYSYPAPPQPAYGYPPGYAAPPPGYPTAYPGYPPPSPASYPPVSQRQKEANHNNKRKEPPPTVIVEEDGGDEEADNDHEHPAEQLVVSGCQDATVGDIVCGKFHKQGDNHGKPFFKRDTQVNDLDVMLYFWDSRDGEKFCGWWFGPKVGGDQVWAYHPDSSSSMPPKSKWHVPYDGPPDEKFDISPVPRSRPKVAASEKRHADRAGVPTAEDRRAQEAAKKEENRRKLEAANQQRILDQQRRIDEKKRQEEEREKEQRRREEEVKRLQEEEARRKEEEIRKKKEAEDRRRAEQKAALAIRKVVQKVRAATPENFAELQAELQSCLNQELEHVSNNAQKLRDEADKGLEQAKKRIEQINEQRRKVSEKHLEEERKRQKVIDVSRERVKELEGLVVSAEQVVQNLQTVAETLENNDDLSVADVDDLAKSIERESQEVSSKVASCTEFILSRGSEMQDIPTPTGEMPTEISEATQCLLERVNKCRRQADEHIASARSFKDRAATRASARARVQEMQASFDMYDKDADGMLSRKEVIAFAKGEYNFILTPETVDLIFRNSVTPGDRGVRFEKLLYMRIAIGVARQVKLDRARQAKQRHFEQKVGELRVSLQEKFAGVIETIVKAEEDLSKCEQRVRRFKVDKLDSVGMLEFADETEGFIVEARISWLGARQQLEQMSEGIDPCFDETFQDFSYHSMRTYEMQVGRMEARITRTVNLTARYRQKAQQQAASELEAAEQGVAQLS